MHYQPNEHYITIMYSTVKMGRKIVAAYACMHVCMVYMCMYV